MSQRALRTDFVPPGGRSRIAMCGKDGTATFHGEHGKVRGPSNDLKRCLIGPLARP